MSPPISKAQCLGLAGPLAGSGGACGAALGFQPGPGAGSPGPPPPTLPGMVVLGGDGDGQCLPAPVTPCRRLRARSRLPSAAPRRPSAAPRCSRPVAQTVPPVVLRLSRRPAGSVTRPVDAGVPRPGPDDAGMPQRPSCNLLVTVRRAPSARRRRVAGEQCRRSSAAAP